MRRAFTMAIGVISIFFGSGRFCKSADAECPPATGKDFHGKDLRDHNFRGDPPGSLRSANFSDAKLSGAAFDGQDLSGEFNKANLGPSKGPVGMANTELDHTCFIGADLDKTDFQFADITCSDFSETSLMQAKFGPLQKMIRELAEPNSCGRYSMCI